VNAAAFLSELRRRDIQIWAVGGELHCNAKAGAMTPELRDELRQRKKDILQLLASAQALAAQERAIVPLQAQGQRTSIFGVPGHNGDVFCYRALARHMGDDQPFFGLQPPGVDGQGEPLTRVEQIAAYFASQICAFQPQGPYIIAGYCAGGTIAFELTQQLLRSGAAVRFLALFGSPYPTYFRFPTQLWQRLADQVERTGKLARELAGRSWEARREHLAEKLRQRRARRDADKAAAADPLLAVRAKVEQATLSAVRRYGPAGHLAGRILLFLPARQSLRAGVAMLRWRSMAARSGEYFGPDRCTGYDMLREPYAGAFAELFGNAIRRESEPRARSA
jgi:thioesterase domain-containing protein